LVALHPLEHAVSLPSGANISPRFIVETEDEHDREPPGREFGALLRDDVMKMGDRPFVPSGGKQVKFSMLREEHYERAAALFGSGRLPWEPSWGGSRREMTSDARSRCTTRTWVKRRSRTRTLAWSSDLRHSSDSQSIGPFGVSTMVQSIAYLARALRAA
jgi:hypothetical protein